MKQWIQDSWYGKYNDNFVDDTDYSSDNRGSIDIFAFLKNVTKIEKKHGEIRNIRIAWSRNRSHGTGDDYEPEYYEYHIKFERLETDDETIRRENFEAREAAKKEKVAAAKQKEEKALLKELLEKYGGK